MQPRPITELTDIYGMRVLVRASLDIPIKDGVAEDHFRVRRALATLTYLIERGARVVILTHVGRNSENSTKPLEALLKKYISVTYVDDVIGEKAEGAIAHMKEGTAVLLENLRSCPEETENDADFAEKLSSYGYFYVNDAFAVSHRDHASIVGLPKHLPSFAGITFMEEYEALSRAFTPEHPSLFILGGAKFETKQPLIEAFTSIYSNTFIGGALANDFLKGKGYEVGTSLLSDVDLSTHPILSEASIILPKDVVVRKDGESRVTNADSVHADEKILDAGPETIKELEPYIANAKTILWNGPLGYYENNCDEATKACAMKIAESNAFSIVGGGDTVASIESLELQDSFGFLSTAGGAMLEFLEKRTLPGIEALIKKG